MFFKLTKNHCIFFLYNHHSIGILRVMDCRNTVLGFTRMEPLRTPRSSPFNYPVRQPFPIHRSYSTLTPLFILFLSKFT